eukprot:7091316-Pyramimonas_sp.AAC.1
MLTGIEGGVTMKQKGGGSPRVRMCYLPSFVSLLEHACSNRFAVLFLNQMPPPAPRPPRVVSLSGNHLNGHGIKRDRCADSLTVTHVTTSGQFLRGCGMCAQCWTHILFRGRPQTACYIGAADAVYDMTTTALPLFIQQSLSTSPFELQT